MTEVAGGSGIVQQRGRSSLRKLARVWDLTLVVWFLADGGRMFSQFRAVCIEGVRVGGLTSPELERVWVWAVLGVPALGVPALDVAAVVRFRWCRSPVRSS